MFGKLGQINRGSLLGEQIYKLTRLPEVKIIVEIGTWNGLGSTKCIYDGIIESGKRGFSVLSLECNLARHLEAKQNLLPLNNFNLIHGTIVKFEEIAPLMEKEREEINKNSWLDEESLHLKNCPFVLDQIPEKIDLLILDGGEFSSSLEFDKLHQRAHFIVLDDTSDNVEWIPKGHILKNSEVRKYILKNPDKFKTIADNQKDRNGFFICEHL
jgi:hypothetical protein